MRYQVDGAGRAGLRAHRSHELIPLRTSGCLIAHRVDAERGRAVLAS